MLKKELKVISDTKSMLKEFDKDTFDNPNIKKQLQEIYYSQKIEEQKYTSSIIPKDKIKILGKQLFNDFTYLIEEIYRINNLYISENILDVTVKLNLDKEIILIKEELIYIAERYCQSRISKRNNKIETKEAKYLRLANELRIIAELTSLENSLNYYFLDDMYMFIINYFSENILNNKINFLTSQKIIKQSHVTKEDDNETISNKFNYMILNNNSNIEKILFLNEYYIDKYPNDIDYIKRELQNLADDIIEMKPFIFNDDVTKFYDKVKNIHKKLSLKWNWEYSNNNIGQLSGMIMYGKDGMEMGQSIRVTINVNGLITEKGDNLMTIDKLFNETNDIDLYKINLLILEKTHSYLYSLYEKIDTSSFLEDYLNNTIDKTENNELKALTLVSQSLSIIDDENKDSLKKKYGIIRNTKWKKFLKILVDEFNCIVDYQGKGDDIKIYRKNTIDTKIYRTSDPNTKKSEILVKTQKNILKQVGISVDEWVSKNV